MSGTDNQIKTGSYAVSTVYSMPWSKKPVSVPKTKRKRAEKKIAHEIFETCSQLTKDSYWVSIFRDCARDKFPRGFSYKNGLLIHRRGNKLKRALIPNSPYEAFSVSVSFFKNAAGLMSFEDRKKIQKEEEGRLLEAMNLNDLKWKDIKAERVKEILVSEFISELAKKMEFDNDRKKDLGTTIKTGFMLKYFTSKNIVMSEGKVTDIEGLIYDKTLNQFYIDPKYTTKKPGRKVKGLGIEPVKKKPKVSFIGNWEKYLQNLDKKNIPDNLQIIEGSTSYSFDQDDKNDTGNNTTGNTIGNSHANSTDSI